MWTALPAVVARGFRGMCLKKGLGRILVVEMNG